MWRIGLNLPKKFLNLFKGMEQKKDAYIQFLMDGFLRIKNDYNL